MKRHHEGEWVELETTYVGETETHYKFKAEVPDFSYFAIALKEKQRAEISVSSLEVSPEQGDSPLEVTITAQVINQGNAAGNKEINIYVDGQLLTTEMVSL